MFVHETGMTFSMSETHFAVWQASWRRSETNAEAIRRSDSRTYVSEAFNHCILLSNTPVIVPVANSCTHWGIPARGCRHVPVARICLGWLFAARLGNVVSRGRSPWLDGRRVSWSWSLQAFIVSSGILCPGAVGFWQELSFADFDIDMDGESAWRIPPSSTCVVTLRAVQSHQWFFCRSARAATSPDFHRQHSSQPMFQLQYYPLFVFMVSPLDLVSQVPLETWNADSASWDVILEPQVKRRLVREREAQTIVNEGRCQKGV